MRSTLIIFGVMVIVAFTAMYGQLSANAEVKPASLQTVPGNKTAPVKPPPVVNSGNTETIPPAFPQAAITNNTNSGGPLKLIIEPEKRIYSSREGLMVKLILKATQRTKVCLAKDVMSQMQVKIARGGELLALKPLVIKDNSTIFDEDIAIHWLEAGQSLTFRTNLKRFRFASGDRWEPAEYNVSATFSLCDQKEDTPYNPAGKETPIKAIQPAWFMIMS